MADPVTVSAPVQAIPPSGQTKPVQEVPKRKVKVKNHSTKGSRFLFDASGRQYTLGPGAEAEIEVAEPVAKQMEEQSKAGGDVRVDGHEPEEPPKNEAAPEVPPEQESAVTLAEAEGKVIEEGQEADKERRERDAKKSGAQLAAETGIHMHARGEAPATVPVPPKKDAKK